MTIAAIVSIPCGLALCVAGFIWIGPWSLPAVLGGIVWACVGGIWLCSVAIEQGLKGG